MPEYPTNPKYDTRQYDDLAEFIKELAEANAGLYAKVLVESKRRVAERLADRLAADNSQFDREKFLKACGVEPND